MSEFISFLPPPGSSIAHYNRTKPAEQQAASVPQVFKDAMFVREEVFVHEQGVPAERELDDDDARSFHWVVYASVGNPASSSAAQANGNNHAGTNGIANGGPGSNNNNLSRRPSATASRLPVGTIRLVPPPHPAHPVDTTTASHPTAPAPPSHPAAATGPYIKLGRLATLYPYRSLGLAKLLVSTALAWAAAHPTAILPPLPPAEAEAARLLPVLVPEEEQGNAAAAEAARDAGWRGAVLVHAQKDVEGFWRRMGFERDEGMGEWVEEGLWHVGMWRVVEVKGE